MDNRDRKKFLTLMAKARVTLPGPNLTDEEKTLRIEVFWEELKPYRMEAIADAFYKAIRNLKFFPTPAEILNFISETEEEKSTKLLPWEGHNEEAREKVKTLLARLTEKWRIEDEAKEKKRAEEFEKNRKRLQVQAKSLLKGGAR